MPRTPRKQQWTDEACYHVMNRGHNRERIFGDDDDRRQFLRLLVLYQERYGLRLYHYCLMTNHFHVLVQLERTGDLSKWLAGMLRAYVHYFNRRYRFVGHLWQGRFRSPAVQCEGYLLSCGRHIERNPLEAGLVTEPWQYAWSSCRAYASGAADPLLAENSYYQELGGDDGSRQRRWREFLMQEDLKEQSIRRADWVVGDGSFKKRLQGHQGRSTAARSATQVRGAGSWHFVVRFYHTKVNIQCHLCPRSVTSAPAVSPLPPQCHLCPRKPALTP